MPSEISNKPVTGTAITVYFVVDVPDKVTSGPNGTVIFTPGSGHYKTDYNSAPFSRLYQTRSWSVTPGFNSKNRPSPLPPNGYSFLRITSTADGSFLVRNAVPPVGVNQLEDRYTLYENQSAGTQQLTYDTSATLNRCIRLANQKVLDNLKDMDFNAAQATAERKQTCDLVASTATKVAKAISKIRKGDIVGAGKALGVVPSRRSVRRAKSKSNGADLISNAWLELQYGWKPLLSDVYGSVEALAKSQNNRIFGVAKGHKTIEEMPTGSINHLSSIPTAVGVDKTAQSLQAKVSCKVGIVYERSSPAVAQVKSLGITNPALIAWELTPYSFVIDWFLPIGNYLSSLDATLGLTFKSGFQTTFSRVMQDATRSASYVYSGKYNSRIMRETIETIRIQRSVLGSFPAATLPSFKNPISSSHVASAMALLLQLHKR